MPYGIDYKRIKTLIGNMFVVKPVRAVLLHYLFMSLFEFFYFKSCLALGFWNLEFSRFSVHFNRAGSQCAFQEIIAHIRMTRQK
jgi:hypothetical protein